MEAAVDDHLIKVVDRNSRRLDRNVRDGLCTVKKDLRKFKRLASGKLNGTFGSKSGKLFDRFIDRNELGLFDQPLACFKIPVLTGYVDDPGIASFRKRMDRFAGKCIVAAHDGISLGDLLKVLVNEIISKFRLPVMASNPLMTWATL